MDIEAAGGAATGGLLAGAIERPVGHAGDAHGQCTDCGEPVSGKFCANCGQPTHVHRSLLHLVEEVLHGVMHFDARIWRTLPLLLLNPGRLTREWIAGKRTRYVSPLALFLFTVFLMFFLLSFGGGSEGPVRIATLEDRTADARENVVETRADLAEARARLQAGEPGAAAVVTGLETLLTELEDQVRSLEQARTAGPRPDGLQPGSWQAGVADAVKDGNVNIGIGDKKFQEKILHKLSNPDFAFYKVQQTLYKFAFLLVPLSIPFVWLMFAWKQGFTWYDHGVFVLYSLTFMAILAMGLAFVGGLAGSAPGWIAAPLGLISILMMLSPPVHMFAQLKGTYGLSIFSALWRTLLLLFFSLFAITLFIVAVILLGLGA